MFTKLGFAILMFVMCFGSMAYGHDVDGNRHHPIEFENDEIEKRVRDQYNSAVVSAIASGGPIRSQRGPNEPVQGPDLAIVEELNLSGLGISDISWMIHTDALRVLKIGKNNISDLSSLVHLIPQVGVIDASGTGLQVLYAGRNKITDLTPLQNLTGLTTLGLAKNKKLSDISPLANLTNLVDLKLHKCSIGDISALAGLTSLRTLHLNNQGNPEIRDAFVIYETLKNNSWTTIKIEANPLNLASVNGLKALRNQHPTAWIDFNEEGANSPSKLRVLTTTWAKLKAR